MGQVLPLFQNKPAVYCRSQKAIDLDRKLKMLKHIEQLEFTKKCFADLVPQLENPADSFTARQMAAETQRDIDKAVAVYTGFYGSIDNW